MKYHIQIVFFIFIISQYLWANHSFATNIDSLNTVFKTAKNDTTKISILLELGDHYRVKNTDSSLYFYNEAISLSMKHEAENSKIYLSLLAKSIRKIGMVYRDFDDYKKATEYYQKALKINLTLNNKKEIAECYNSLGVVNYYQSEYKTALAYYSKSLKISTEIGDKAGMTYCYANLGSVYSDMGDYSKALDYFQKALDISLKLKNYDRILVCYNNIGIVYSHLGNYEKALDYYIKSLKISEKKNDLKSMSTCYNNLGSIYYAQGNPDKALEYYLKTLNICEKSGSPNDLLDCYSNLGNAYKDKLDYTKALDYYNKSIKIALDLGDKIGLSICYSNIGALLSEKGNYSEAINYFKKSLVIDRDAEDKNGMAYDLVNIATSNISLATEAALSENQRIRYLNEAILYGEQAFTIANEIKALPMINEVSKSLKTAYAEMGNIPKAYKYANEYIWSSDTMYNIEKNKVVTEMEARYTSEKKQLEIEKLEKDKLLQNEIIAHKNAENYKQQLIIYFFVGGFIIILIFSLIIYRLFIQKRKANILLTEQKLQIEEKNEELNQQNEEITSQRDEIEAQRDEITAQRETVTNQKDELEKIYKNVTDSIHYAKHIQSAILPSSESLTELLKDYFIIFKPRNIVSGDFYWAAKRDNWLIFVVADCTGHGVPGAFMSMLGISFLNEIIPREDVADAGKTLDELRSYVIRSLQQKGISGEQKDGMDISFCALNTNTLLLQYAGANNPVYIIKKEESQGNILIELNADKMPVAIHPLMNPFTTKTLQLHKGDLIYLFTDGVVDQFGGTKGQKYKPVRLKETLLKISSLPIDIQKAELEKTLTEWQAIHEQLDDITLMGVKV